MDGDAETRTDGKSVSKSVAPPTSLIANLQATESANLGLTYTLTPKMLLAGGVSASRSTSAGLPAPAIPLALNPTLQVFSANVELLQRQREPELHHHSVFHGEPELHVHKSVQANFVTPDSVILLALTFNPY